MKTRKPRKLLVIFPAELVSKKPSLAADKINVPVSDTKEREK